MTLITANSAWLTMLQHVLSRGRIVHPRQGRPGSGKTLEVLGYSSRLSMEFPCVTISGRKLSTAFMAAEAAWILSGDDRVSSIEPFAPSIRKFSDDGLTFFGAYGPRIKSQIDYVVNALHDDDETRQAAMTIWRPSPPRSKDIPCTVAVQWVIRDGKLHCIDTMRSSDVWLGWPYDVFNFSMLSALILLELRELSGREYELGDLILNAGSQHLYDRNWVSAQGCCQIAGWREYVPFDWRAFPCTFDLVGYLRRTSLMEDYRSSDPQWIGNYGR